MVARNYKTALWKYSDLISKLNNSYTVSIIAWIDKSLDIFVQMFLFYVKYAVPIFQRQSEAEIFRFT